MSADLPERRPVKRYFAMVASNIDTFLGLTLAVVVGALGLAGTIRQDLVNSAILLVLALLAQAVLRDRWRRETADRELRAVLGNTTTVLTQVPSRLDKLTTVTHQMGAVEEVLSQARDAFGSVSMVRVLHGAEVGQALADARAQTDRWHFKGGTGTYLRAVTLRECVDNARRRNSTVDFQIEIIDPTNEELCERYAVFRRSLEPARPAPGDLWTIDRARKESFATILAAYWHRQRSGLLKIDVHLSSRFTTFRYDLSATSIIITQENPHTPALQIMQNQIYYNRYNIELQYSREQCRSVPIGDARAVRLDDEPTVEQVRKTFATLGVPLPKSFGDREVADIVRKTIEPENPYA